MESRHIIGRWAAIAGITFGLLTMPGTALAHCDTLDGPVVAAARKALDTNNVNLVLIWVQKNDEAEIRKHFKKAVAVRKAGEHARLSVMASDAYFPFPDGIEAAAAAGYAGSKACSTCHPREYTGWSKSLHNFPLKTVAELGDGIFANDANGNGQDDFKDTLDFNDPKQRLSASFRMIAKMPPGAYMLKRVSNIPFLYDLETRLRKIDEFGDDYQQVFSVNLPPVEAVWGPDESPEMARVANDSMAEICAGHGDRFPGFVAALPLNNIGAAIDEAERAVKTLGAKGVQIFSNIDGHPMDEEQFFRLTRRAISHLGDLPKLSVNPLMNLPAVLAVSPANPLDRVHMLKALLIQSIQKLKPHGKEDFGTTDEWRYYNSIYFPYVLGLKPYTRRMDKDTLDETSRLALDWFQNSVPERTLHNWQNAAAKLVANELRNQT